MDAKSYTSVPTAALEDVLKALISTQAVLVNDRMSAMLRFGEYKARPERPGLLSSIVEKADLEASMAMIHRLTLLISTCRSILFLTTSTHARAELHFPALRAKIPYATALVMSMVGSENGEIDVEGTMTLAAFTEFYSYLESWKVI